MVADFANPIKTRLSLAARGLRLCKQLAEEPGWSLWRQADVAKELQARWALLQRIEAFGTCLPLWGEETFDSLPGEDWRSTVL